MSANLPTVRGLDPSTISNVETNSNGTNEALRQLSELRESAASSQAVSQSVQSLACDISRTVIKNIDEAIRVIGKEVEENQAKSQKLIDLQNHILAKLDKNGAWTVGPQDATLKGLIDHARLMGISIDKSSYTTTEAQQLLTSINQAKKTEDTKIQHLHMRISHLHSKYLQAVEMANTIIRTMSEDTKKLIRRFVASAA